MKARTVGRHLREGSKNLIRNGWMTFASISAVAIMLFIVGVFLLLIMNVSNIVQGVEDDVEIMVFIDLTASEEQQDELLSELETIQNVENIIYVDREEGLEQFITSLDEYGEIFESMRGEENPLNDVFVVRAIDPHLTEQVANQIEDLRHVEKVDFGRETVERLFAITNMVRTVGLVLVLGMMFTAMFLIANTIKLTIVARKREIQIMKLVGATNAFIRWPFFIEGVLLGGIGAIIPIVIIGVGYYYLTELFDGQADLLFSLLPVFPITWQIGLLLLLIGAFIGIWGSMVSVRKFLKV
ncbi:permease-like cell division protein FtsX [Alkalihalobacillus hemicellulosilyticus]|uniref:Cell division protein FtsX n=1 Tax=Halalkalibacter hemicellulosilyticusJCM 9152 TaxID=1236971 RepID=W4QJQ5_9BACI|nr:permease-like cell division protein FtsX [Halalkalibacter hemicellulosilyticus]GAE31569.1 cell division protein FtsX [Halalkalibacter hemicellulosilyticusJCM 9152]